ncbi:MAG: hypothetical protein Tsb0020_52160 [Haliangiales bacterium]
MSDRFQARIDPISDELLDQMRGRSWHEHPACPAPAALALITMNHWGLDGRLHPGELVVASAAAEQVVTIFEALFAAEFPIARMVRIDAFDGDDDTSMAANNCSGFNFRVIAGTDRLSNHALGWAIDINPVQNPWLPSGGQVQPTAGQAYLDRGDVRPGMIVRPGPVTDAFDAAGWEWGGDWDPVKDYHHFSGKPRQAASAQ